MDELSPSDSGYGSSIGIGSDQYTQAADNSGNVYVPMTSTTMTPDLRYALSGEEGGANAPVGNSSLSNYVPTGSASDLSGLAKFLADNKGLALGAGALAGLMGAGDSKYGKTGYQGTIPRLAASRTMVTAPPTRAQGYRPGAGGIDYGGDVTYTRMPAGTDPWAGLSGATGTAAGANLTTPGGIAGGTTAGGTNTGGTSGGTKTTTTSPTDWRKGMSDQQYLDAINQWLATNQNANKADIAAAMAKFGVSATDLQTALGQNKMSAADKYALTHGMGFAEANAQQTAGIKDWLAKNPYATAAQIADAVKASGVDTGDINQALTGSNVSGAYKSALTEGLGLNQLYKNILDYQASGHTADEIAAAKDLYKVSDADIAAAQKFANEQKYTPQVQAAVPEHSFSDSVKAILADQKAVENQAVNENLANLGLGTTDKVASTEVYQPFDNTDYSYMQAAEGGYLKYAGGGEIPMAKGRYLQGATDGMADELPAQIGNSQPAALSHGEFVIPADVVSHMGNGNSDAGAKKLYQMMDKIRMARTGTKKQGKKINPDKFMPGGLAASKYAKGGDVKHFLTGGTTGTSGVGAAANAGVSGVESNLSNWAGDYVTNMLGQGQALANLPYTAYMGPLTAGESSLQTGAFKTAGDLTTPASIGNAATNAGSISTAAQGLKYTPNTSSFDSTQLTNYMNPYLDKILAPQLEEARRQSQITQTQNAGKMTSAGAFGGGRQAILDAETQRNLATTQAGITGAGYNTAYQNALSQFNADQARKMAENQYGAGYGLQGLQTGLQAAQTQGQLGSTEAQTGLANLNAQLTAGNAQRGIESEGIAADKAAFEEARANPYKMVQFQQSLLQGLPLAAQSYNLTQPSTLSNIGSGVATANDLLNVLLGNAAAKKA